MSKRILITGGAGFIGSHLSDELLEHGYKVRVLDSLLAQVHGMARDRPDYLNDRVELIKGDVRDKNLVRHALKGVDAVYHFAARVGVGQSMYEIKEYMEVNDIGTSVLLEVLSEHPTERLVIASSMSIYGEGMYRDSSSNTCRHVERNRKHMAEGLWEPMDEKGHQLQPLPTPETKSPSLASVYALSKYDQERLGLIIGQAYDIPVTALRFFNVYGSRQALSNPYTGVLAIFSSRYLNNKPPLIFEDGLQQRDFVHVKDVARACRLALETSEAAHNVYNIGSGRSYTIKEIAEKIGRTLNKPHIKAKVTGKYRAGDIRHCYADISKAESQLGFSPHISLEEGMEELVDWLVGRSAADYVDQAKA
ncbi:MAG TPA: SDR family NAD(P)-dependent oxidoreductase, partial [Fodinibius sp.]|nr:SDR family NAD(P)-dependent oxidoreductase [Fodinibius sp.]